MSKPIYLVTGAAGFLGSTICRQLVAKGKESPMRLIKAVGLSNAIAFAIQTPSQF